MAQGQELATAAASQGYQADGGPAHHGPSLGSYLCWAVVFADIGTSVYYVPGILFQTPGIGSYAALYVVMTMMVFIMLAVKYAEVTVRYPEGGGVVTVGTRAIHPFVGLLGGMFILVDYFLTAALSALSGIIYFSDVVPGLSQQAVLDISVIALVVLGLLNWIGISESAKVSAVFATVAFTSQIAVVLIVIAHIGLGGVGTSISRVMHGPPLTPLKVLGGYAGAFLAFSGLESISQLSPVMRKPRRRTSRITMSMVVVSMVLTSPLLTLLSTTLLNAARDDPNQFISILGRFAAGRVLEWEVAISGALLLIFASNTAIIGSYHVFLALSRMRFFPQFIENRNRLRGTPHWAIFVSVGVPLVVLVATGGSATILGDLYAFGLLGAFSVTCLSLDIVRWRERRVLAIAPRAGHTAYDGARDSFVHDEDRPRVASTPIFVLGVLTTVLVFTAWSTNLFNKPAATFFGGGVTVVGLLIALVNYARLSRQGMAVAFPAHIRTALADAVLVLLPRQPEQSVDLVRAAAATADGRPVVFAYLGNELPGTRRPRLFEVVDPYLDDRMAQDAFGRAERLARRLRLNRRYVYIPASQGKSALTRIWQILRPRDTLVAGDAATLHDIAADRIRRPAGTGVPIVHYLKNWA